MINNTVLGIKCNGIRPSIKNIIRVTRRITKHPSCLYFNENYNWTLRSFREICTTLAGGIMLFHLLVLSTSSQIFGNFELKLMKSSNFQFFFQNFLENVRVEQFARKIIKQTNKYRHHARIKRCLFTRSQYYSYIGRIF